MIKFLDKETVLYFHSDQIKIYGGSYGIRDENLLESALARPKATLEGKYLHKNIFEKSAAYGYHLCKNHPFIDGNKRIALIAMVTLLYVNGYELKISEKEIYLLIMGIANNSISKKELTDYIKKNTRKLT
jgi:death on curing protein